MLQAQKLCVDAGGRRLLDAVDVEVKAGSVLAVLGPNGAGKTTLLRALSGELRPTAGTVRFHDRALHHWPPPALARGRAVMNQADELRFGFDVREVVRLGRHPWGADGGADDAVGAALQLAGATDLADRRYTQLSSGERARVRFARALAQLRTPQDRIAGALLLDEPTANLDLAHQHELLHTARRLADDGAAVLVVLHDLNLALQYTDRALLLDRGRTAFAGTTSAVLTPAHIEVVFGVAATRLPAGDGGAEWIAVRPRSGA